ncbi:MAG: hypothetical protein FWD12_08915 [Alphaproteobacteria bacterium]|nr:hypothetical protein [Alphaproteobacteria bacterium]
MTLDPKEAAASLGDVAAVERRTREALYYAGTSEVLLLWGILTVVGNLLNWFRPHWTFFIWLAIDIGGSLATIAIIGRRLPRARWRRDGMQWLASYVAFVVFGTVVVALLWPLTARQQEAFWPTLVMFGYVLSGIWVGRFFLIAGVTATAAILLGYYFAGDWFLLWLAFVFGGGLIAGSLWLRRAAV